MINEREDGKEYKVKQKIRKNKNKREKRR